MDLFHALPVVVALFFGLGVSIQEKRPDTFLGIRMLASFRVALILLTVLVTCLVFSASAGLDRSAEAENMRPNTLPSDIEADIWGTAPPFSNRLIVEFGSPALAEIYAREQFAVQDSETLFTLDSSLQTYAVQLENEYQMFQELLLEEFPRVRPSGLLNRAGQPYPLTFAVVKNGAVFELEGELNSSDRIHMASLPNVKNVFLDFEVFPQLYAGPALTHLKDLWSQPSFNRRESGKGIRIASIDAGLHKDAPMFDGSNFTYPAGYPQGGLGIREANNGKIVASRTYFRPNFPPAASDHFAWPGSGSSHGIHTAAIAAGNVVTDASFRGTQLPILSGVAPGAWLGNYRVFYQSQNGNDSFFTAEGVAAIEDSILDGMDIIIGSWGSGPSINLPPHNFLDSALVNTVHAGVIVVMAAGNYGPLPFSVANPSPEYMTVGAVSTSGRFAMGKFEAHTTTQPDALLLADQQYANAALGPHLAVGTSHTFPLVSAQVVDPNNARGCDPWLEGALDGQMLLVQRGQCTFRRKVEEAQLGGASAVLVFNHAAGGQSLVEMASDGEGNIIRIPSLFIGHQAGILLSELLEAFPDNVTVRISTAASQVGNQPRIIPNYSGRGPTAFGTLKPDLVAPGDNILSQGYGPADLDSSRHLEYGQTSGTSMAAPFVAGAVALIKEKHPSWTHAMIRSALMNTAQYQGIFNEDGSVAEPTDMGAGLIDLVAALETQLILSPPKVDFGRLRQSSESEYSRSIQLTNLSEARTQFNLSVIRNTHMGPLPLPEITVEPAEVTLEPGTSTNVALVLQPNEVSAPSFLQGYLVIESDESDYHAPVFAWLDLPPVPQPLLLIDADLSPLYPDYAPWYQEALGELNLPYIYWDATSHEQKVPSWINSESGPEIILLFAGDNHGEVTETPVPVAFSTSDLERLENYVLGGGSLWVMGKDIDLVLEGSNLMHYILRTAEMQRQTEDRFGLAQLDLIASPSAPDSWQALELDVGAQDVHLGTVNLLTGEDVQMWGWNGQYLSGEVKYEFASFWPHLLYHIHLQGGQQFKIDSAQFFIESDEGDHKVIQELLGAHAPLTANGAFRWKGILPVTDLIHQARTAGKLKLRIALQGNPPVTLETRVPTRVRDSDNASGSLPLHGINGTAMEPGLLPLLGTARDDGNGFRVVGVSRNPPADSEAGTVFFTTFGLEHVNNANALTTRSRLLRTVLLHLNPELAKTLSPPLAQ